jgi:3-hydroxyacyl-CoA dehydrogenase/enoyl-CoA hydratase/3-hydroxybutyryl-CoA epimerase
MSPQDQDALLSRITAGDSVEVLKGCDLIIEAVFENRELKARVTQEAEPMLAPGGSFASNTSTLPITGLAKASRRPEKFVGIHFFSPVDKMKLVEIIRGKADRRRDGGARLRLCAGHRQDTHRGQRFARLLHFARVRHFVMEGAAMVGEGIPARSSSRRAPGRNAGGAVGRAGRDGAVAIGARTGPDPRRLAAEGGTYIASPGELLVERMVKEFDRNGRAAGAGFYEYPRKKARRSTCGRNSRTCSSGRMSSGTCRT